MSSKSSIKVKCLKKITGICEFGFHQLWMLIQLRKLRSILLCVTYRPDYCPTSTFHDIFMENYLHALTLGKEIIVVGDLNFDLLKPDSPETIATTFLYKCESNSNDKRTHKSNRNVILPY